MRTRTNLLFVAATVLTSFYAAAESEMIFSYADPSLPVKSIGFLTATTYDACIKMPADYVGKKISGVKIPVQNDDRITDYKIWITTELALTEETDGVRHNNPNVCIKDVERNGEYVEADFDSPYTIVGDTYVGYTFTVTKANDLITKYPLKTTFEVNEDACWVRVHEGVATEWKDYSEISEATLAMGVKLRGDFAANMVDIAEISPVYTSPGEYAEGKVTLVNFGSNEVKEVEYEYVLNGKTVSGVKKLDTPLVAQYGARTSFKIRYNPMTNEGTYNLEVTIKRLDGKDNDGENPSAKTLFNVMSYVPKHRPVFEEFTGTWCGWCPSGLVGVERVAEDDPENIVISYHGGDVMTMKEGLPISVSGFPYGTINRSLVVDPYYGLGDTPLGIVDAYRDCCEEFTPADVKVEASWADDDHTAINVKSTVNFVAAGEYGATYKVGYVLLADGLTGKGSDWTQINNYSGYQTAVGKPGLEDYVYMPEAIEGLVYNDVAVYMAGKSGLYNSLPGTIAANTPMTHEYTIKLEDCVNMSGASIIQDPTQLKVVAIVYKEASGKVTQLNAARCKVPGKSGGNVTRAILFEEFTGTWCGNCTRGIAGIEFLNDTYPNVITVSYHSGRKDEVMNIGDAVPSFVKEYPTGAVNRNVLCDPYFGVGELSFDRPLGVEEVILDQADVPVECTMIADAEWVDENMEEIKVTTTVNYLKSLSTEMNVGYLLLADGLKGEGAEWLQSNSVVGFPAYANLPYMERFYDGTNHMNIEFNDVVIWSAGANGIAGSLPRTVSAGSSHEHSTTIKVADAVNLSGTSLVQDKSKLRIVTYVVKTSGGAVGSSILTAAKANIRGDNTQSGVWSLENSVPEVVGIDYYDLSGRRIANPDRGIYVKVTKYSDGSVRSGKIIK